MINLDYDLDYELIVAFRSSDQFVLLHVRSPLMKNLQRICDDFFVMAFLQLRMALCRQDTSGMVYVQPITSMPLIGLRRP